MDDAYEKSRKISRLIKKGMTTKEIKKKMQLEKAQLCEIVQSKYSAKYCKILFGKLEENDYFAKTKILVDTSALKVENIVEYLCKYHKILLHVDVIHEMDEHKFEMNSFGANIRALLKRSAEDYDSLKIKVITPKRVSLYTDENLIQYLKKKAKKDKNIVIITADNALASLARGYGIKYILAKSLKVDCTKNDVLKNIEDADVEKKVISDNSEKVDIEIHKGECPSKNAISLEFVKYVGKTLFLCPPDGKEDSFLVLEGGTIKKAVTRDIPLKCGDKILQLVYTRKRNLKIQKYKITDTLRKECAEDLGFEILTNVDEIGKLAYSSSVKSKIRYFYNLNKKPK